MSGQPGTFRAYLATIQEDINRKKGESRNEKQESDPQDDRTQKEASDSTQ